MSKLYLPHADQFDQINENLMRIASAIGADIDVSTWAGIQKAVRVGVAPNLIPIGTQLTVNHVVYGDMLYDVVAHNHFKSARNKNAHTMTLMCHDVIRTSIQFDAPEAFYYADGDLTPGTYNFTISSTYSSLAAGTYCFTLTKTLPAGGQLCIVDESSGGNSAITDRKVYAYDKYPSRSFIEKSNIVNGSTGTSLGTLGKELNHVHRVYHGSNNYKESAVRQFLNSSAEAGSVWIPQTKYDCPPKWSDTLEGFMKGLDEELLNTIGEVIVPCSTNDTYESPDSTTLKSQKYEVVDRIFLASQQEVLGTSENIVPDDSVLYPFFENATDTDRIKYNSGTSVPWGTRSAQALNADVSRVVTPSGYAGTYHTNAMESCVPVFTIV